MELRGKRRARSREAASDPAGERDPSKSAMSRLQLMTGNEGGSQCRMICAAFGVTSYFKPQEAERRRPARPAR